MAIAVLWAVVSPDDSDRRCHARSRDDQQRDKLRPTCHSVSSAVCRQTTVAHARSLAHPPEIARLLNGTSGLR